MTLLRLAASAALTLTLALTAVGCKDGSDSVVGGTPATFGVPGGQGVSSGPTGTAAGTPGQAAPSATGVVGNLTGEPDGQVDPQLQNLVGLAFTRGDTDEPLEGF